MTHCTVGGPGSALKRPGGDAVNVSRPLFTFRAVDAPPAGGRVKNVEHEQRVGTMGQRRILPGEIEIGSVLPWDVYDARGRLLLRRGHQVVSDNQIGRLIEHGLFAEEDAERFVRPIERHDLGDSAVLPILEARRRLEHLCTSEKARERFPEQILALRQLIADACTISQDAALATAIFERQGRYSIRHSMDVAITCHVVGNALEMDETALTSTVAAALTMNLSVLDLQDELQAQKEPLTAAQREVIQRHPHESTQLLRELGVADPVWLEAVLSHHEALDGSGYGAGRKGEEISLPAQLVSLGDVYCARISSRKYRRALRPNAALRALFLEQGKKVSQELASRFIKAIGVFPAGTPVRLDNGEIAVVTSRGEKPSAPEVSAIVNVQGMPYVKPLRRDTNNPTWRVREVMEWNDVGAMPSMQAVWGKVAALN